MIGELLDGRRPEAILVGTGPGSFTGIRVAVAAAHGLAIGWDAPVQGMSSLALMAAEADRDGPVAVAVLGGHGEIFVQEFDGQSVEALGPLINLAPDEAAKMISASLVLGSGAPALIDARGTGEARDCCPSARNAFRLPATLRSLEPRPLYARAPDARPKPAAASTSGSAA